MHQHCNFKVLTAVLMLLIVAASYQLVSGQQERCFYAIGDYRNCTCGVQYRIVEKRCCSPELCTKPVLTTENLKCPSGFECQNGGTFDDVNNRCRCKEGYYGLCCHKGVLLQRAVM